MILVDVVRLCYKLHWAEFNHTLKYTFNKTRMNKRIYLFKLLNQTSNQWEDFTQVLITFTAC